MALELGIKGSASRTVTEDITARALRSGGLDVLSTPIMIALMEEASLTSVGSYLKPGEDTVGTKLNVSHLSATPLGMKVNVVSEIIELDRSRILFKVSAYDETGLIGEGTHERFVINTENFVAKSEAKKALIK